MQSSREAYLLEEIERLQGHLNAHTLDLAMHGHVDRYQPAQNVPRHGGSQHFDRTRELSWPIDAVGDDGTGSWVSVTGNDGYRYYQTAAAGAPSILYWTFVVPQDYVSGGKFFVVWFNPTNNTDTVSFNMGRAIINAGTLISAIINYDNAANTASPGTINQTAKTTTSAGQTYTAGDLVKAGLIINPDQANPMRVVMLGWTYTADD